jgi:predicted RNase H-like HicB family nuclease
MRSFILRVVLEQDEDVWRAYVPELEAKGAATWGHTREEALKNIQEVAQMVIEELRRTASRCPRASRYPTSRSWRSAYMTVDYSRLHSVTARQLISALERDGFALARQKGRSRA